jgi:hypothetical protein
MTFSDRTAVATIWWHRTVDDTHDGSLLPNKAAQEMASKSNYHTASLSSSCQGPSCIMILYTNDLNEGFSNRGGLKNSLHLLVRLSGLI